MSNKWRVNPYTDRIQYLGGWLTSPNYRGCIVQETSGLNSGSWAVCPRDPHTGDDHAVKYADTVEAARAALENVTPGGHLCEVFVNHWLGHCPERAAVVTNLSAEDNKSRGLLLCSVHSALPLKGFVKVPVMEWEADKGPITHENGPIIGERVSPPMARVNRGKFLSRPMVWGDQWDGYTLRMKRTQDVVPGDLVVFDHGNAYAAQSVDVIEIPHGSELYRINCNGGTTYGTYYDRAVPVLEPEWGTFAQ